MIRPYCQGDSCCPAPLSCWSLFYENLLGLNKFHSFNSKTNLRPQTRRMLPQKSPLQWLQEKGTLALFNTSISTKQISSQPRWHLYRVGFWLYFSFKNEARISSSANGWPTCYKLSHLEQYREKNSFLFSWLKVTEVAKTRGAKSLRQGKLQEVSMMFGMVFPLRHLRGTEKLQRSSASLKGQGWQKLDSEAHLSIRNSFPQQRLYL